MFKHCSEIILLALIAAFSLQCSNEKTGEAFPEVSTLSDSVKRNAIALEATEIVAPDDFINAKEFYVHDDSILVVVNKPSSGGYMIELCNLFTKEKKRELFRHGNGPGEMLNVTAHVRDGQLIVHDFVKHQLASMDMDSILLSSDAEPSTPHLFCSNAGSPFVTFLDDDRIIMLNPYFFESDVLSISNGESRFLLGDSSTQFSLLKDHSRKVYSYNVEQGFIIPDISHDRVLFASSFYPQFALYDGSLNPQRRIDGPDCLRPSFRVSDGVVTFDKQIPYGYRSYALGTDCIYLVYIGSFLSEDGNLQDFDSYIFQIGWDGRLVKSFHSEHYLGSLSVSSDGETFFCRSFDSDGSIILLKLTAD